MFTKPTTTHEKILKYLSDAYNSYSFSEWRYGGDAGIGGFLLDGCITDSKLLDRFLTIIGHGLCEDNQNAKQVCLLFSHLYHHGFQDGYLKDEIRARFKEILPAKSIEKLNNGTSMEDCMKSICIYNEVMHDGKTPSKT